MATEVQIVNKALQRIGVDRPIASLSEASKAAQFANACFADERDFVLRDFPWPFATGFKSLALVSPEETAFNARWFYAYRYPSGAVFVRNIVRAAFPDPDPPPFVVASDDQGRLILTNEAGPVTVEYTIRITDAGQFDPVFSSMLAWKIGAVMAPSLSRIEKAAESCMAMYRVEKTMAEACAANEGQAPADLDAEWIRER